MASLLALLAWMVAAGPLRSGVSASSMRLPILVLIVVLMVTTVRRFDREQRDWTVRGLIAVGALHAAIALTQVIAHVAGAGWSWPPRTDSLLGYPNALGILLVATTALTARELESRRHPFLLVATAAQALAVLTTGSRLALVLGAILVLWAASRRGTWLTAGAGASWILVAGVIVWSRSVGTPPERWQLWQAALAEIAQRPWVGRGTVPTVFDTAPSAALTTTHAHNEVLQFAVEYGLVGLALAGVVVVLAYRSVPRTIGRDQWIVVAALSLLAGGLTDFSLRIPAIAVTASVLVTMAMVAPRPTLPQDAPDAQAASGADRRR